MHNFFPSRHFHGKNIQTKFCLNFQSRVCGKRHIRVPTTHVCFEIEFPSDRISLRADTRDERMLGARMCTSASCASEVLPTYLCEDLTQCNRQGKAKVFKAKDASLTDVPCRKPKLSKSRKCSSPLLRQDVKKNLINLFINVELTCNS